MDKVNIPPPQHNGGLFTGQPFGQNVPWANVYVRPSVAGMTEALKSANPPPNARYQYHWNVRPGNNTDDPLEGVQDYQGTQGFGPFNFKCVPCERPSDPRPTKKQCKDVIINIW